MAEKHWEELKIFHCERADREAGLQVELIYPQDFLGDQPRVAAHRCTNGLICNQRYQNACVYAGTNPWVDPLRNS